MTPITQTQHPFQHGEVFLPLMILELPLPKILKIRYLCNFKMGGPFHIEKNHYTKGTDELIIQANIFAARPTKFILPKSQDYKILQGHD